MKPGHSLLTIFLILAPPFLALGGAARGSGIPVVDAAHIATSQANHTIDFIEQVLHEANQQTQILNELEQIEQLYEQITQLYEQIEQMDDYLERFGIPEDITDLAGIDGLLGELKKATEGLDIEEKLPEITGEAMFGFDGEGVFAAIGESFQVGGGEVEREAERYKPEDAARETVKQYRDKKTEVIERRDALKAEVASTTEQLRFASTDSEVKKLTGVLVGLQTELQAVDRELDIAGHDAAIRAMENDNQRQAVYKAQVEEEAKRFAEGNRRDVETYKIDTSRYGW